MFFKSEIPLAASQCRILSAFHKRKFVTIPLWAATAPKIFISLIANDKLSPAKVLAEARVAFDCNALSSGQRIYGIFVDTVDE